MKTKEKLYRQLREIAVEISDLQNEKILPGYERQHESRLNNLGDLYNRTLDNLISKIRKDDIDGLMKEVEGMQKEIPRGYYAQPLQIPSHSHTYNQAISDIIAHLDERARQFSPQG